jgi:FMNH2-dependent dimethyl sulfone monooxygenase
MWAEPRFSFAGDYYRVEDAILEPKPVQQPRPVVYAGGESPAAKEMISEQCDAYLMHGDPPATVAEKIAGMRERRRGLGLPDMVYGVSGYVICRDTEDEVQREYERVTNVTEGAAGFANFQQWLAGTELEQELQVQDYSVSNRGLKSGLVGTPEQLVERLRAFEAAGVDLVLLQFSPQLEEMERFSESVIARYD